MNKRCDECMFAQPAAMEDALVWECRRFPPQIVSVDATLARLFPQVNGDDWCGEFKIGRGRNRNALQPLG